MVSQFIRGLYLPFCKQLSYLPHSALLSYDRSYLPNSGSYVIFTTQWLICHIYHTDADTSDSPQSRLYVIFTTQWLKCHIYHTVVDMSYLPHRC